MAKKTKPSRTTNRLHFTDLDPGRFEDLCLLLVQPMHPWIEIRHYGRPGADGGVDIYAKERVEGQIDRVWTVQCRRYAKATKSVLTAAVDDALASAQTPPDVLLVVVAADPRREAHEAYVSYAASMGVSTPLLWTASLLEAKLYNERRDLLFTFFDISTTTDARKRETTIVRNIALKAKLRRELRKRGNGVDWNKVMQFPPEQFVVPEIVVHSVDDTSYPGIEDNTIGISGWFKVELWDFYHNGIEVILSIQGLVVDDARKWAVLPFGVAGDVAGFQKMNAFHVGLIPFANILEVDMEGDEYYSVPHLYCRFANGGQPYEGFKYVPTKGNTRLPFAPENELQFASIKDAQET